MKAISVLSDLTTQNISPLYTAIQDFHFEDSSLVSLIDAVGALQESAKLANAQLGSLMQPKDTLQSIEPSITEQNEHPKDLESKYDNGESNEIQGDSGQKDDSDQNNEDDSQADDNDQE